MAAAVAGRVRRFTQRGCTSTGLLTDSRTGAMTLYGHVGMRVTCSFASWSRELCPTSAELQAQHLGLEHLTTPVGVTLDG